MRTRLSENERLKKALRDAHFARPEDDNLDSWRPRVMRRIRGIRPPGAGRTFWSAFEQRVWRLAPLSGIVVLALAVIFLSMDFDLGQGYSEMFTAGAEEQTLTELFGFEG